MKDSEGGGWGEWRTDGEGKLFNYKGKERGELVGAPGVISLAPLDDGGTGKRTKIASKFKGSLPPTYGSTIPHLIELLRSPRRNPPGRLRGPLKLRVEA